MESGSNETRSSLTRCLKLFVLTSIFGTPVALANPEVLEIAGAAQDGVEITLVGNRFGNKATAQPLIWDTFESGTDNALVGTSNATVGRWDTGAGSSVVRYSAENPKYGQLSALNEFSSQNYITSLAKNGTFKRVYMDYWVLVRYNDRRSRNWKMWRMYGDRDRMQLSWVYLCNSALMPMVHSPSVNENKYGDSSLSQDTWYHVQLTFQESDPNFANGTIRHTINHQVKGFDTDQITTRTNNTSFDEIRIGHYWGTSSQDSCPSNTGGKVYIDNVYVDTSWSAGNVG